jgi:hypothetical protein
MRHEPLQYRRIEAVPRFVVVPVLSPLRRDLGQILVALSMRVSRSAELDLDTACLEEAAEVFHAKAANPRRILAALTQASLERGAVTEDTVRYAAQNFCPASDVISTIYDDLWALKLTSFASFFPWSDDPAGYPYPPHIAGVVDQGTGMLRYDAIDKEIEKYRPYANV